MRCGCPACGTYMVHSESLRLGCVCPACGRRCTDCLGTNTVLSRDQLRALAENPRALDGFFTFENGPKCKKEPPLDPFLPPN